MKGKTGESSKYESVAGKSFSKLLYKISLNNQDIDKSEKKCKKCGEVKKKSEFYKHLTCEGGRQNVCKLCKRTTDDSRSDKTLTNDEYLVIRALRFKYGYNIRHIQKVFPIPKTKIKTILDHRTRTKIDPNIMEYKELCKGYIDILTEKGFDL